MGIVVRIAKGKPREPGRATGGKSRAFEQDSFARISGATVSAIAQATGGIRPGGLIETDRK